MNWKEIKKKYPKSIELLKEWLFLKLGNEGDLGLNMISGLFHTERRLYDFFDEQGIIILINYASQYWNYTINNFFIGKSKERDNITRKQAEEQAFLKAFEILEKSLK